MGFYHALAMLVVSRNNRYRALVRLTCIMLFEVEKPNPNLLTLILILFVYNVSEILRDHFSKHTGLKPGCKVMQDGGCSTSSNANSSFNEATHF